MAPGLWGRRMEQAKSRIRYNSGTGIETLIRRNLAQKDVLAGLVRRL